MTASAVSRHYERGEMYGKIVVPLDGSPLAEGILPHVIELIRGRGSQVYLLSVAPLALGTLPAVVDIPLPPVSLREEEQRVERELAEYLQAVARRLEPVAAGVQVSVRFGRQADEILDFAAEVEADLIAMSSHGRSGIGRWVFGSVAERVLRGAACPVLLVRPGAAQPTTTYQRVVVPLDGSESAEQALPYVMALIQPRSTRIFLVSVLTAGLGERTVALLTSYPPGLRLATTALQQAEAQLQAYLRGVAAALRERGAMVHTAIRQGAPADEILAYAAEVEADLITMTTHGLSGVSRWVYGNVAGKVLQSARTPVLLVRPTPEQEGGRV